MAKLLSVNVGMPKDITWHGKTVHTSVWKHPITGKRRVRRLDIDGDAQGDLLSHGGEQRAVLVYQIESYRFWERELRRSDFVYGQFGENLTVTDLPDEQVCIGDRYQIGTVVFEVTQPRVTCYRVGVRLAEPRMAALLVAHHRPGFYMRVIQEGELEAGDDIVKVADGPEHMSVTEADALMYLPGRDAAQLTRALRIAAFSPGWKAAFQNMAADLRGTGWAENRGLILNSGTPARWSGFRPLRVVTLREETPTVLSLELDAGDLGIDDTASPGQFITLRLPVDGSSGSTILRSYSLTSVANPHRFPIAVKHEAHGAAGAYLWSHVRVGDALETAAPRGGFVLRAGPQPVVLLSAGIGLTPLLAMLRALVASASDREVWWCHGARNGVAAAFASEVDRLLGQLAHAHRLVAYSHPRPNDRPHIDFDIAGRLNTPILQAQNVSRSADFYLCGPSTFMRDLGAGLVAWGVAQDHVRTEHFGPTDAFMPGVVEQHSGPAHQPAGAPGTGPEVSFVRSGLSVRWSDRYASLLELAEACNVKVRFACRTGVCHTCITRLLGGSVEYAPEPLERPTAGNALICCSHPTASVTLDL